MRGERAVTGSSGWWGPAAFAAASLVAAPRQPGYSPVANHVSGLAARGTDSARVMVPGFVALGAGQLCLGHALRRCSRGSAVPWVVGLAGLGTIGAGVAPVSSPACPTPGDAGAEPTDTRHAAASVVTFLCWLVLPALSSGRRAGALPRWHRAVSRVLVAPTAATFIVAAATTRSGSPRRGLAQRLFLGSAFVWQAATSVALAGPPSSR